MKVKSINYSKVFSLGNYENEKIGVEIELQENDDVQEAMQQAKQYVEFNHKVNGFLTELDKCDYIINNPDEFTGNQVKQAMARKEQLENNIRSGKNLLN